METEELIRIIKELGIDLFIGVPDSLLKRFSYDLSADDTLTHIPAPNEGNAVALAAGAYLSTGKVSCVYMQNSGIGNAMNPITSLTSNDVYGIPILFIIGWRGEPGKKDEPQHVMQGRITLSELDILDISYMVIKNDTSVEEIASWLKDSKDVLSIGKSIALVVQDGSLSNNVSKQKSNGRILRERALEAILESSKDDIVVTTTGKTSRELYEIRERRHEAHNKDFLTVGSMGHCSMIALGMALRSDKKIWCIDGDGALLMHMGSLASIGSISPKNLVHIVINNSAHESVGGMPTAAPNLNISEVALSCGYRFVMTVDNCADLERTLESISGTHGPIMIEILAAIGSRDDLGRPKTTPKENKEELMRYFGVNDDSIDT